MRYKRGNSIGRIYSRVARRRGHTRGLPRAYIKRFGIRRYRRR